VKLIYFLLAILIGCGLTLQGAINSNLKQHLGNPIAAAVISFSVGTIVLLLAYLALPNQYTLSLANLKATTWWMWLGGILGAFYIVFSIIVIPEIGFANFFILLVAGQILLSIVFDQWGLWGYQVHSFSALRGTGIVLMIVGIYLIQKF